MLSREIAQGGRYPAIDVSASLSRVMDDVAPPQLVADARELRRLVAAYEANRDLVLMGAWQPGRDALIDRAMAMHEAIDGFLAQHRDDTAGLADTAAALAGLLRNG